MDAVLIGSTVRERYVIAAFPDRRGHTELQTMVQTAADSFADIPAAASAALAAAHGTEPSAWSLLSLSVDYR